MVALTRPPIEKWNRSELEDNYHQTLEQMRNYQKKNNDLEKKVLQLNSKFRRAVMERKSRDGEMIEKDKYDQLYSENQLLSMKLKAVKHQLLTYTTPTARSTTALAMTGRSTFRPPSTFRRPPPSSASVDDIQSARRTARTYTADNTTGSRNKAPRQEDNVEIPTKGGGPGGGGSVRIVEGSHHEKAMVIRLNRQIKEKNGQINSLQYEVDSLKAEIEKLMDELNQKSEDFKEFSKKRAEATDSNESWVETEILRRELTQIKEELRLVTSANERLVKQSLANEMVGNEKEVIEMKKKIIELEENLKEKERRTREAERKLRQERRQIQGWKEQEKKRITVNQTKQASNNGQKQEEEEDIHRSAPKYRKTKEVDDVLNKLYQDISKLLESHESKDVDDVISLEISETQKLAKWQKMYSELYEELEKVRNMLLLQHNINQKQTSEINLLREECDRLKLVGEQKLEYLKITLQDKQKHVDVLQQQIHEIAYSGQKPIPLKGVTPRESELSTRLSLRLTGIKFSNARGATSVFMSLEFFDFELQTTPVLRAIDQPLDFTTSYDVVVSNLLIHYLQTNGITVEIYRAKSSSYEFLGAGTVSLNELLGRKGDALLGGHLPLREIETGHVLGTLSYELSTTKELGEALGAYRRAETAQKIIPLPVSKPGSGWHELAVSITKCTGLGNVSSEPMEVCLVYELLAFSPYATDNLIGTGTVNFQNEKKWNLPSEALQYFSDQNISFYLMDRGEKRTEEGVIGMMSLPLTPLLQNSTIKGTFPMVKADGSEMGVSLDVDIKWTIPLPRVIPNSSQAEKPLSPSTPDMPTSPPKPPRVVDIPPEEIPEETYSEEDIESVISSDKAETEETVKEIEPKPAEHGVTEEELVSWENLADVPDYLRTSSEDSQDTFTKEVRETEIEDEAEDEEYLAEKRPSHLSDLPILPPVAKPRLSRTSIDSEAQHSEEDIRDHLVGFSSPLHHSIPPSDTSSVASPRKEKPPVKLPSEGGRSAIKPVDRLEEEPEDKEVQGTVTISIVAIRNTAYSPLMERRFEGAHFFVDWKFLDFPDEECRVTESQPLPVIWDEPIIFDFTKEYHLSKRKVALLEQYIENQNHMEFCLVTDAGLDSEELAVASLELMRIPPNELLLIPLLDVNGVRWADLEMSLSYSENIFDTHASAE